MFSVDRQVDSAGRALSAIISKMIKNKGLPFNVYSTLYFACVSSISLYGCEVFGFQHSNSMLKLQLRASRAYLGLPKTTASCGLISEFDWLLPKYQSYIKMIQFFGRIMLTSSHRLLYKVYKWDRGLNDRGQIKTWSHEIKSILNEFDLGHIFESEQIFPVKTVISQMQNLMKLKQNGDIKAECFLKPKLRSFVTYKDFSNMSPHMTKPLSFVERNFISKLRLGNLPLRVETGRFCRPPLPEQERVCYCGSQEIETEAHLLFQCNQYENLRQAWLESLLIPSNFNDLPQNVKFDYVLNKSDNIKQTARFLVSIMDLRSLLNKVY